jgi:hypothetical protein
MCRCAMSVTTVLLCYEGQGGPLLTWPRSCDSEKLLQRVGDAATDEAGRSFESEYVVQLQGY